MIFANDTSTLLITISKITLFPDPTVADASLDRVAFNSIRINLKGSSMREQLGEKQLKNYK